MKRRSPTLEGFRVMFRRPSFGLAEVSWRWGFGGAATAAVGFTLLEYMNTLPVTAGDLFLLRSHQPSLIGQAISHILRGSAPRLVHAFVLIVVLLSVGWIILAMLGRAATARGVLSYLSGEDAAPAAFRMRSLAGLSFLRAVAGLAAVVGFFGAILLGGLFSPDQDPSPGRAMVMFAAVLMLVALAWVCVNWFLSLATLFVVAEGDDTFGAMAAAVGLCRERFGPLLAASSWFGLAHSVAYFIFSSIIVVPLMFAGLLPAGIVIVGVVAVSLIYFFIVDFFYIGRLAAYLFIIRGLDQPEEIEIGPVVPGDGPAGPASIELREMDPDEVIMSDVPLAPEGGVS